MKLSVVIVNYKSWQFLSDALNALLPNMPDDWEVIVVDNESEPSTYQDFQSRFPTVKTIANPANSGFGMGCILGVEQASGEQLLFMNPDVVATSHNIQSLIQEKASLSDVAILAPRQTGNDGKPQKVFDEFPDLVNQSKLLKAIRRRLWPARYPDPRKDYDALVRCDWVTGSVLLISRNDYERIGGWSRDYWMYVEDADLCRRACDAGLGIAYTPHITVKHVHGGSSKINVKVRAMTKLEVIISKHVYASHHFQGVRRLLAHGLIGGLRLPGLALAGILDLITFRRVPLLSVRGIMLLGLLGYYGGAIRRGTWVSPRALANQS